jgi:hypothetical protein
MARWKQVRHMGIDDVLDAIGLERKSQVSDIGMFFSGLGLGLVGGAVASILMTPYRGTEAREKLARAREDLGRTMTSKVHELTGSLKGQRTRGEYAQGQPTGSPSTGATGSYDPQRTRVGSV